MIKKRNLVFLAAGLMAFVAVSFVGLVVAQPAAEAARNNAQLDLILEIPRSDDPAGLQRSLGDLTELVVSNIGSSGEDGVSFSVDSFFDVFYARNIGSSGLDGVRFSVDSFFDIEYQTESQTIDTEILSMSLSGTYSVRLNEAQILDKARAAGLKAGGDVIYGHVTILK